MEQLVIPAADFPTLTDPIQILWAIGHCRQIISWTNGRTAMYGAARELLACIRVLDIVGGSPEIREVFFAKYNELYF